jgi:hypothetical protein
MVRMALAGARADFQTQNNGRRSSGIHQAAANDFAFEQGDDVMKVTAALIIAGLLLSTAPVRAGPCSNALAQFEQAVRESARNLVAGPTASQTVGAQTGRQPTPDSVKRAEESAQATFETALARAKSLDEQGDQAGCSQALADAQRMYSFR